MSQKDESKRRKVYLNVNEPFAVPRSTLWYSKRQPVATASANPSEFVNDPLPTASDDPVEELPHYFADSSADSSFLPVTSAEARSTSDECDSVSESESGGPPLQDDNVPVFDDAELLAQCVTDFGTKTLPGSTTTVAAAVFLIMSFVVAHGLTWSAVNDLLLSWLTLCSDRSRPVCHSQNTFSGNCGPQSVLI